MDFFPASFFIPVPVKRIASEIFWYREGALAILQEAQKILDQFAPTQSSTELDLGIISSLPASPMISFSDWENHQKDIFYLKTERFFDPYNQDVGAGRNAILGPVQYKGIGRNHAAARADWLHSWGGMEFFEMLTEITFEQLLIKKDPEVSVPILAAGFYQDNKYAFIIRSSEFIRCDLLQSALNKEDKHKIIESLDLKFDVILLRLIHLMKQGFYHESTTKENITLDGRLLDHASMERISHGCLKCEVVGLKQFPAEIASYQDVKLAMLKGVNTNFDYLLRAALIVKDAFDRLDLPTIGQNEIEGIISHHFEGLVCFSADLEKKWSFYQQLFSARKDLIQERSEHHTLIISSGKLLRRKLRETAQHLMNVNRYDDQKTKSGEIADILKKLIERFHE